MPYLVQSLFDLLHVGLIDRSAGVDPLGDLIDILPDGGQLGRERLYIGGVGIDDITVNRHLPQIGADPLCGEPPLSPGSVGRWGVSCSPCRVPPFLIRVWDIPTSAFSIFGQGT